MSDINYLALVSAAILVFIIGAIWYTPLLFGNQWMSLRGLEPTALGTAPAVGTLALEFLRCLAMVVALAVLISLVGLQGLGGVLLLALVIWAGFQAALLSGSVLHEGYPPGLFAIHAGDALAKIVTAALVLGLWR